MTVEPSDGAIGETCVSLTDLLRLLEPSAAALDLIVDVTSANHDPDCATWYDLDPAF